MIAHQILSLAEEINWSATFVMGFAYGLVVSVTGNDGWRFWALIVAFAFGIMVTRAVA